MASSDFTDLYQRVLQSQLTNSLVKPISSTSSSTFGTTVPSPQADPMASELRRRDALKIQFNDLRIGDRVAHNNRDLSITGAGNGRLFLEDGSGFRTDWDSTATGRLADSRIQFLSGSNKPKTGKGAVDFDSVIVPDHKKQQIIEAISQVDHHDLIFKQWGFEDIFEKGTAISLLFYGLPGTGKTLMAQAIADKYGKKLVMVSTAEIETPEPGGAERNLKKYFEEAQKNGDVLLFDECDSLITDRGRVGMILAAQINALLSELEKFTGIVVFTTNRLGALDAAFERRLSLKLEFEMPEASERLKIWQRMFPKKAPVSKDVDWVNLAQVPIAGGHIKNIVLKAARAAASRGHKEITYPVIWECLEKEIASLDSYTEALEAHNPWYGTPVKGGQGGEMDMGLSTSLKAKKKLEIQRG